MSPVAASNDNSSWAASVVGSAGSATASSLLLDYLIRNGVQVSFPLAYPVTNSVQAELPLAWVVFSPVGVPELLCVNVETAYKFIRQVDDAFKYEDKTESAYPFKYRVEDAFEYEGEIAAGFPALQVAVKKATTVCGNC